MSNMQGTRARSLGRVTRSITCAFLVALSPSTARASCPLIGASQAMAFPSTVAVFTGKVVEVGQSPGSPFSVVTFEVERMWKGELSKRVSLHQGSIRVSEDPRFSLGDRYFVVASHVGDRGEGVAGPEDVLGVNTCATAHITDDESIVRELGPGHVPQ